jgi:hypothetical protein
MYKTLALISITFVSALLFQDRARADNLVLYGGCSPYLTSAAGPLTYSGSCTLGNGGTQTESDSLSYASLGTDVAIGSGNGGGTAILLSYQNITVGGIASGTPVDLNFELQATGSYSYSIGSTGDAALFLYLQAGLEDVAPLTQYIPIYACGTSSYAYENGDCNQGTNPTTSLSGLASLSIDYFSGPEAFTAGTSTLIPETLNVQPQLFFGTSISADFLDPTSIINIEVTNPTTGLAIPGATVTSDAGVVFPVNGGVSTTPEPSSLLLLGVGLLGLIGVSKLKVMTA